MAALPPPPESSRRRGRAAGIGATVLGVLVAIAVALLFILVIGADKGQWASAGAAYHARLNPARYRRRPPPRAPPGCQINQAVRGRTRSVPTQRKPRPTRSTGGFLTLYGELTRVAGSGTPPAGQELANAPTLVYKRHSHQPRAYEADRCSGLTGLNAEAAAVANFMSRFRIPTATHPLGRSPPM